MSHSMKPACLTAWQSCAHGTLCS